MNMPDELIRARRSELRSLSARLSVLEREFRSLSARAMLLEKLEDSTDQLSVGKLSSSQRREALQERTALLLALERHPAPENTADDRTFLQHFRELRRECAELDARLTEIRRELIRDFKRRQRTDLF